MIVGVCWDERRSNRVLNTACTTHWPIIEQVAETIEQDLVVLDGVRAAAGVSREEISRGGN
ncbi:MAG TPA: hypothetical protein VLA91_00650 [Acidimicrobiia bacterium]|nr:hypothetical protein [Acidimicrobiia bacterium]